MPLGSLVMVKHRRFALIAIFLCSMNFSSVSMARNMDITIEPGALIGGVLPLRVSFGVTPKVALGLSAATKLYGYDSAKTLGFSGGIDAKIYLTGHTFNDSWYLKPRLIAGFLSINDSSAPSLGLSLSGGYNWVWNSGFTLDLGLVVGYSHWFSEHPSGFVFGTYGLWPGLDLNLGFAF